MGIVHGWSPRAHTFIVLETSQYRPPGGGRAMPGLSTGRDGVRLPWERRRLAGRRAKRIIRVTHPSQVQSMWRRHRPAGASIFRR